MSTRQQSLNTWNKQVDAGRVKAELIRVIAVDIVTHGLTFEQIATFNPSIKPRTIRDLRAERSEQFGVERLEELQGLIREVVLANTNKEAA